MGGPPGVDFRGSGAHCGEPMVEIHLGECLEVISTFASASFDLIYIDPPFNTGKTQARTQIQTRPDANGDRTGFAGRRYRTTRLGTKSFDDSFSDYLGFLEPRLEQAYRLLKPTGSFFLHLDYREVHYAKVLLDSIFGRDSFMNEIIWAYDYGARATRRWSAKHDNILWFAKDPSAYTFRYDDIDRIPYMRPDWLGPKRQPRERPRRTPGGTPLSAPAARRKRDIRLRSHWRSWIGSCAYTRIRATGCSTSLRAVGRLANRR
ncbi:MAG: Adenine specific DNA methylase Mod [Armatimonadetes bacterium OLB18]|nr:MAG: Adenine specific DNA methylase Mod [Armatimonadetes bacterium OLB18]